MKKFLFALALSAPFLALFGVLSYASQQPEFGLVRVESSDPTAGAGFGGLPNEFLIRTDTPALYYFAGPAATNWVPLSGTPAGGITGGPGTTGVIPRFTGASSIANGSMTDNGAGQVALTSQTSAAGAFTVSTTGTGLTVGVTAGVFQNSNTFNTTGGGTTARAVNANINAARSAGANPLTNQAVYANATGAQTNQAIFADSGDVQLNNTSGNTFVGVAGVTVANLTVNGAVVPGEFDGTTQTIATCTSDQTAVALNANTTILRVNAGVGCALGGIVAPTRNRLLWVTNVGSSNMPINHLDAGASAGNKISNYTTVNLSLSGTGNSGGNGAFLLYDTASSLWFVAAQAGSFFADVGSIQTHGGLGTFTAGITLSNGDFQLTGPGHWRCSGTAIASCTNCTCTSTHCTDCGGVITASTTAPAINFQGTFTGANDASCIIQPYGTAAAATGAAHTATQWSFTATNGGVYGYHCDGMQ